MTCCEAGPIVIVTNSALGGGKCTPSEIVPDKFTNPGPAWIDCDGVRLLKWTCVTPVPVRLTVWTLFKIPSESSIKVRVADSGPIMVGLKKMFTAHTLAAASVPFGVGHGVNPELYEGFTTKSEAFGPVISNE